MDAAELSWLTMPFIFCSRYFSTFVIIACGMALFLSDSCMRKVRALDAECDVFVAELPTVMDCAIDFGAVEPFDTGRLLALP